MEVLGGPIDIRVVEQLRGVEARSRPGVLGKVVISFAEVATAGVAAVRAALEARDPETLWRAAHKLRSAAIAVGAAHVGARCAALEQAGRAGQLDGLAPEVEQLGDDVAVARTLLQLLLLGPAARVG